MAAIIYAATLWSASNGISTWEVGSSDPAELLVDDIYRIGLTSAGALGALFGIGFAARRDGPVHMIGGIATVFAGVTLAIIGYQAPDVEANFVSIFVALIVLAALMDALSGAVNREYVSLILSMVLALIMAVTYYSHILYGMAFIISALVWVIMVSLMMAVYDLEPEAEDFKWNKNGKNYKTK